MKKTISLGDNTKSNYIEILEEEQTQIDPPMSTQTQEMDT